MKDSYLYGGVSGFAGGVVSLAVGIAQHYPNKSITLGTGAGDDGQQTYELPLRFLPFFAVVFYVIMWLPGLLPSIAFPLLSLPLSYLYLRIGAPRSLFRHAMNGVPVRGDRSAHFTFASLFPQPFGLVVSLAVAALTRLPLVSAYQFSVPARHPLSLSHDMQAGMDALSRLRRRDAAAPSTAAPSSTAASLYAGAFSGAATSGASIPGGSGQRGATAVTMTGSAAERRRAKALQALDRRLAQMALAPDVSLSIDTPASPASATASSPPPSAPSTPPPNEATAGGDPAAVIAAGASVAAAGSGEGDGGGAAVSATTTTAEQPVDCAVITAHSTSTSSSSSGGGGGDGGGSADSSSGASSDVVVVKKPSSPSLG